MVIKEIKKLRYGRMHSRVGARHRRMHARLGEQEVALAVARLKDE